MSGKNGHIIPPEELMAFLDGQLNLVRRKAVEEHLKTCPECRSLLESLELAEQEVARVEKVEAPEGYFSTFASRVANRIARKELAPKSRPWLLRWGWMPAAAAAAFAAVIVLSHGFYEQPRVFETARKRQVIPIPIAPEPRVPETVAMLETYYEGGAPETPGAPATAAEKDLSLASGTSPMPATAPPVVGAAADEVSAPEELAGAKARTAPGVVDMTRASTPKPSAEASAPSGKTAGPGARKSGYAVLDESAPKAQPTAPALPPAKDKEMAEWDDDRVEWKAEVPAPTPADYAAKRKAVRSRRVSAGSVLLPAAQEPDTCALPDVSGVEAIVIHLPNGGQPPPPDVGQALRICIPQ